MSDIKEQEVLLEEKTFEQGLDSEGYQNSATSYYDKVLPYDLKKKKRLIITSVAITTAVLLLIIVVYKLVSIAASKPEPLEVEKPQFETGLLFDMSDTKSNEKGSTSLPVIEDFTVSKSSPVVVLYNPVENKGNSYLKYVFINKDTNEVIYESDLVEPGLQFEVSFGDLLDLGTYNVNVGITSYDYETYEPHQTGTNNSIVVTVVE